MDHKYLDFFLAIAAATASGFLLFKYLHRKHDTVMTPVYWPVVGMLPHLLLNLHRFHEWCIGVLNQAGTTFPFKGPWFSSMNLILTVDPANVHHVMSKNFENFPKGDKFAEIFDILGDGIFSVDFDLWKYQRRVTHSFLTHPRFHRFFAKTIRNKAEKGLIPIIENACQSGRVVDLEDLFQRFTFDTICTLVTGRDTCCLSMDLPDAPFCKALDDAEEVLFYRHVVPESIWKLQRWLGVGKERKLKKAWETLDKFIYKFLALKREEMMMKGEDVTEKGLLKKELEDEEEEIGVDLLTLYLEENHKEGDPDFKFSEKFLRDTFLNLLIAGRDTTSAALTWFFWLLHKNPKVEAKIRQEIRSISHQEDHAGSGGSILEKEEVSKLVYLHGALCETLRLYPPVPMEHKSPLEPDVLPSGHHVNAGTKILFNLYAMGRMEFIWGEDCSEFQPERWITERGNNKHEPSYKFLAFNAGPRTCLGKDMAFAQMNVVASCILLHGYHLEVVDEEQVNYDLSIILHTKRGLRAKVSKETI